MVKYGNDRKKTQNYSDRLRRRMDDILDVGESNGWSSAEYRKALLGIVREERTALRLGVRRSNKNARPWSF